MISYITRIRADVRTYILVVYTYTYCEGLGHEEETSLTLSPHVSLEHQPGVVRFLYVLFPGVEPRFLFARVITWF